MPPSSPERLIRKTTSIAQLLARRVHDTPDREAYRYPVGDQWRSMTWRQSGERVRAIAAGLLSLGLDREDRVGILCNTRVEWLLADLGVLSAGGATTTVYPSSTAEECAYILADSAAPAASSSASVITQSLWASPGAPSTSTSRVSRGSSARCAASSR